MTDKLPELRECPFCGSKVHGHDVDDDGEWIGFEVDCLNKECGFSQMYNNYEDADAKFNRRPAPQPESRQQGEGDA